MPVEPAESLSRPNRSADPADQMQADLAAFSQPCIAAGEIIQRDDGARMLVHFLGDVPAGEVFKTSRGNTMARAGHGRVALLGGRFELDASHWAEEAAAAGPSIAASLPSSVWMDQQEGAEKVKFPIAHRVVRPSHKRYKTTFKARRPCTFVG